VSEQSTTLVELTRAWIEADSYEEWSAFAERLLAPDCVWVSEPLGPVKGKVAIVAFVKEYWATWQDHHHYAEEVLDLGHGVMFSIMREHGLLKGSDAYVENRDAWVSVVGVDGRVVRSTVYKDIDEGRAAAERLAEEWG
jgi:hypothetical protein